MAKKHQRADDNSSQHVRCPIELIRCGKALSVYAKAVYLVIASYNPSYPGIRRIAREAGISPDTVQSALKELLRCNMIHKTSGKLDRATNEYRFFSPRHWKFPKAVPPGGTPPPKKRTARRHTGVPPDGTTPVPPYGKELDQLESDQLIIDGAPRYPLRTTTEGGVENPQEKVSCRTGSEMAGEGVALTGDKIRPWSEEWRATLDVADQKAADQKEVLAQYKSQLRELLKARTAGAISEEIYQAKLKEIAAAAGQPTFLIEPKEKKKRPVGSGVKSNLHARV